jgi:hypothetical protein
MCRQVSPLSLLDILALLTDKPLIRPDGVNSGFVPVDSANATKPEWSIRIDNG